MLHLFHVQHLRFKIPFLSILIVIFAIL